MIQLETLLPELRAYARSIAGNREDAEDLVQDAVERTLKAPSAPARLEELRPWMFRVIRNLNLDEWRKRRVRREYSSSQSRLLIDMPHGGDHADSVLIRMTLETLPPPMREVLFLVDVMGMKYAEAAEVMEVPPGTVMSRVSRARRAMIDALESGESAARKDKKA